MDLHKEGDPVMMGILICCFIVLLPVSMQAQQVYDLLEKQQETSEFARVVQKAGLHSKLNSDGPYTIFAPSNSALRQIDGRLNQNNTTALQKVVLNHILTGMATKRHIAAMSKAPSLGGVTLRMQEDNAGNIKVNDITISRYNIRADNGIIHVIEGVLE